jgi:hypothetical protein
VRGRDNNRPRHDDKPAWCREDPSIATVALIRKRTALVAVVLLACAALGWGGLEAGRAQATTASAVSANWAGYAVTGAKYRRVTGTWVVPSLSCTPGSPSASAAWLGLGGFEPESGSVEQTGTQLECTNSGDARYAAWYELLPAAPVTIPMKVRPGDSVSASVTVARTHVAMVLRNRTTGERFAKRLHMSAPDVTSAEWIVEAPSACTGDGSCDVLPLSDFGSTSFSHVAATSTDGHRGNPADVAWSPTALTLNDSRASATPSGLSSNGSSFSVTYQQGAVGRRE